MNLWWGEEQKVGGGGGSLVGGNFSWWGRGRSNFWLVEGDSPISPPVGKTLHFTHVYQKSQSYDVPFLRHSEKDFFGHFGPFFALLAP